MGRVGEIVKRMFGGELVKLRRRFGEEIWRNCEEDVWGRVGGIVKRMFGGELVKLRRRCVGKVGEIVKRMFGESW